MAGSDVGKCFLHLDNGGLGTIVRLANIVITFLYCCLQPTVLR